MVDTLTSYRMIASNMTRSLTRVSQEPLVERETAYYLENIGKVKSIDDFMADDRLYRYAMKAHGLEDMAYAKAFVRKILTEGVSDDSSFANTLTDKRYKELATTFDFAALGETTTSLDQAKQGTVDKYVRQTLEEEAGDQNEGVRLALYFERKAKGLTNAYEILGDKALLTVVQTALGIPSAVSYADIDKQAQMIEQRLDISALSDPDELAKFMTRFTAMYEISNPSMGSASSIASLLLGGTSSVGISTDILTTLQSFKPGGR
ncbi:flagellar biosynthesis protein FlgF [Phyllobacterium phragmitis]|uniref:Flagellar biosynthesis protein FlgF n=1 Tax=Phyllobacterium phragmitis TaxID=2670329 RepID=A0A2S9IQ79_9HYPH|nr:DUF1217 domain-containing protein [Phyllobacterium phragmitis]PRD42680.1 flagellar biosynthesis protein FlgF [Phyllobacterium phragmitis]